MACNTCAKSYSIIRKEKGCPNCGFGYCSKCLNNKLFIPKLNAEVKVCVKCKLSANNSKENQVQPPDAYFKRLENMAGTSQNNVPNSNKEDEEILLRLKKLKANNKLAHNNSEQEIAERLQNLKGKAKTATDEELQSRLAKLKNVQAPLPNMKLIPTQDLRTEQEQADELIKQYTAQTKIEENYNNEFDQQLNNMQLRLQQLKGTSETKTEAVSGISDSEDEEETARKIIRKIEAEALIHLKQETTSTEHIHELPFCEICNEDATRRCVGCRYLFCKRCFLEHKDDDDGCNKFEEYTPPKNMG